MTFTGLNAVTREVVFRDNGSLPASVTLSIDASWVYILGTVNLSIPDVQFTTQSIFNGDYLELALSLITGSSTTAVTMAHNLADLTTNFPRDDY